MPNTIRLRRGSTVPSAGSFVEGEPAWDSANGKLYIKNAAGTMVQIGGGTGGGSYTFSSTAPSSPAAGDEWTDSDDGITYQYVNDGNSSQWVELGQATLVNDPTFSGGITIAGTTSGSINLDVPAVAGTNTITFPAVTGNVVTTGDSGTVTGAMIAPGAITDADVSATAAIVGTKISPDFGNQLVTSSANPGVSLTGSVNASNTTQGVLSQGTLSFSAARVGANFQSSQAQYYQVILQNSSNATNASCDFVVCNDTSTDSTNYGNFGINSSTYSGSGIFNQPGAVYITATSGPLGIGTTTAHDIRFAYNGEATDALTLGATDATFGKIIKPRAGTTTAAPIILTSGTNLTTAVAGAIEYDGSSFYSTPTTTPGRGQIPSLQTFRLAAAGSALGPTIADFFGANSSINLAANESYKIKIFAYFQKNTAGTVTWTLTASSGPSLMSGTYRGSPVGGIAAGTPIQGYAGSRGATTAAFAATASISANAFMAFEFDIDVLTNLATNLRLRVTSSAGTVTPQAGSYYSVQEISGSVGSFAA